MDLVARSGHVGGKGYVHILQMILRLRLICAHGRELLGEDDMAALAGMTSSDAINVDEIDDNSPNLSPKQAYQLFSLMKETNQDMCTLCQHKAVYKDPAVLAEESEKDKDVKDVKPGKSSASTAKCTTIGYLTTCAHILCKECVPRFTASITTDGAAFEYGTRGTCPICSLYNKLDLFELKWDEMAEHESGEASGGPGRKKNFHYRGPSTKVSALLQDLLANRTQSTAEDPIKSVVFSCWTTHMDLIELAFNANGIRFVRLDGKLSRSARNAAIAQFREDSSIEVILVSLMAGGLGSAVLCFLSRSLGVWSADLPVDSISRPRAASMSWSRSSTLPPRRRPSTASTGSARSDPLSPHASSWPRVSKRRSWTCSGRRRTWPT